MIGSGRDAIAKPEQLAAAEKVRCTGFRPLCSSSFPRLAPVMRSMMGQAHLSTCRHHPSHDRDLARAYMHALPHTHAHTHTTPLQTCLELDLDGIVVIGGDDSNTNSNTMAEHFLKQVGRWQGWMRPE